jgi:TonB family protein
VRIAFLIPLLGCAAAAAERSPPPATPVPEIVRPSAVRTDVAPPPGESGANAESVPNGQEEVIASVRGHMPRIRGCYEEALLRNPAARGRTAVQFAVQPDGRIAGARVSRSDFNDPTLESCLVATFQTIRVEPWSEPAPVEFEYPLQFSPQQ